MNAFSLRNVIRHFVVAFLFGCCIAGYPQLSAGPPVKRYAVGDPGPGMEALRDFMQARRSQISCGLAVYLSPEMRWDDPRAWLVTLAIDNLSKEPVRVPMAALNRRHAVITTTRVGKAAVLPYLGTHDPIENTSMKDEGFVQIPSGARMMFAFPLPVGHPFWEGVQSGDFVFTWPFHPEARFRVNISATGGLKFDQSNGHRKTDR